MSFQILEQKTKVINIIKLCTPEYLKSVIDGDSSNGGWSGDTWKEILLPDGSYIDINFHNQTDDKSCQLCAYPVVKSQGSEYYSTDTLNAYFEQYSINNMAGVIN